MESAQEPQQRPDVGEVPEQTAGSARFRQLPASGRWRLYLPVGLTLLAIGALLGAMIANDEAGMDARDLPLNTWFFTQGSTLGLIEYVSLMYQYIGSAVFTAPLGLAFGMWLFVSKRWQWGVWFAVTAIGGLLIAETVKHVLVRARPVWDDPIYLQSGYSFPSGHTTNGVTTWVAIGVVLFFVIPRPWSTILGWCFVVFGTIMGISRWFLGVHWITDVLGGWAFGFGWLFLVSAFFVARWGRQGSTTAPN